MAKLNFKQLGEGEPIIILHGLYGSSDNWVSIARELMTDFHVYLPDLRNHGASPHLPEHNYLVMADDLLEFMNEHNLTKSTILGHSMGGTFLVKYLAENDFPKKVAATFLVAAPYYEKGPDYSLADFKLPENLEKFKKQAGRTFFYHSEDDPIVSLKDFEGYKQNLNDAMGRVFKNRGHFLNESFPELIEDLKSIF